MDENRVTLPQLIDLLRHRANQHYARNLVLVALSPKTAHREAPQIARALDAEYVDFDCQLVARMEADDWDDYVSLEQRGTLSIGQILAQGWLTQVAEQINGDRPLVVGNLNLSVRYEIDVAAALYDATERGLCVIAAAGHLQGQTLLIHGRRPQTGAGSTAYQVIPSSDDTTPSPPSGPMQDRLL